MLVIVAGIGVYANSFSGEFLLDDQREITKSEKIHHLWPPWDIVARGRRPVVDLSLAANYAIGGLNVWGYHAFNLAVHILAALTVFGIVRRTLLRKGFRDRHEAGSSWFALVVALIWVVHPLQTQSVTYIIQRAESLMGLFYLVTVYCVARVADSSRGRWWCAAAVAACALGMGSKAVMVSAPLVVLLYDRIFIAGSLAQILRRRWGLYLGLAGTWSVLVVCGIVGGVLSTSVRGTATVGFSFKGITPIEYALTQPGVILHYLRLAVWPYPLCFDYVWSVARTFGAVVPPALVVIALLGATLWAFWRKPRLGFVGAWFFLILSPTSSFIPIKDPLFEHRMYLPLAAVVVLAVMSGHAVLEHLSHRFARVKAWRVPIACGVVLTIGGAFGYATVKRNRDYHNDLRMWADVVAKRPDNYRAHLNLGNEYYRRKDYETALAHYRETARIKPHYVTPHQYAAHCSWYLKRVDEGLGFYKTAAEVEEREFPNLFSVRLEYANHLAGVGRVDEALRICEMILSKRPSNPQIEVGAQRLRQQILRQSGQ
ncbi:MAG: tetratricopeptide repeat protein [Phycisphaerae bacterium]